MKVRSVKILLSLLAACMVVSAGAWPTSSQGPVTTQPYPSPKGFPASSWALGVVVPEGAVMTGGGVLHWEEVGNVTALLTLPLIGAPDLPVYAVVSLMMKDESVLQVAAGIPHNGTTWSVYADYDRDAGSVSPTYEQVLNSSQPQMSPGASVLISIFRSSAGVWSLKVEDVKSGAVVTKAFPASAPALKRGDQEVFALESYSKNQTTFQNMGHLSLNALFIDGESVGGGLYPYGDWSPNHDPLFVVGSLGTSPPLFISLVLGTSLAVWSFDTQWESNTLSHSPLTAASLVLSLALGLTVVAASAVLMAWTRRRVEAENARQVKVAGPVDLVDGGPGPSHHADWIVVSLAQVGESRCQQGGLCPCAEHGSVFPSASNLPPGEGRGDSCRRGHCSRSHGRRTSHHNPGGRSPSGLGDRALHQRGRQGARRSRPSRLGLEIRGPVARPDHFLQRRHQVEARPDDVCLGHNPDQFTSFHHR